MTPARVPLLLVLGFALGAPVLAAPGGTDVLHLSLRTELAPDGGSGGAGQLSAKLRQQGHADVQKLTLEVSGLAQEATHHLFVWQRDALVPIDSTSFETDEDGAATLQLKHLGHKSVPGKEFPDGLDPLSDVVTLEVRDPGDVVVLEADLSDPDELSYLVKRRLTNEGVEADAEGSLLMKQRGTSARFRVRATGLTPNADYELALLDGLAETLVPVTADAHGRLDVTELPDGAPAPFDLSAVELRNGLDEVVLRTDLP